jgi:hypothetical protein
MKRSIKITLIVIGVLAVAYFCLPQYARKALIYQKAGIDDYKIFDNRSVENANPQPWKTAENYNRYKLGQAAIDSFAKYQTVAYLVIKDTNSIEEYWMVTEPKVFPIHFQWLKASWAWPLVPLSTMDL